MKHPILDFCCTALIPEICSQVAAASSNHLHLALVTIATVGAFPDELAISVCGNLDFSVPPTLTAVIGLGVQFCVHNVVVDVTNDLQHSRNVVLHVGDFYIADCQSAYESYQ